MRIPRAFNYQGVAAIIENGVARDLVKAGMATLVPATNPTEEAFDLMEQQVNFLIEVVSPSNLERIGLT